jgi:hypothetical protein
MGNQSANITFSAPVNNGGSPIVEYYVMAFIGGNPTGIFAVGSSSPIEVTGLTNGTTYTFEVYAKNGAGLISQWSAPSNPFTPAPTVPSAPLNATASPGNASAVVSFSPPSTNGGQPIEYYTATSFPGSFTATGTASAITVTGLTNGTPYYFQVTATNSVGTGVASNNTNSVTPSASATVPGAPTSVSAIGGNAQGTVSFSPPLSNGGSVIEYYTATSVPGSFSATGAASPITVTGLSNGTSYYLAVTATNAVGTGAAADSGSFTPSSGVTNPSPPTAVSGVPGNGLVTVSFTAPSSTGGAPITLYTVTSNPLVTPLPTGGASPIVYSGLTNGQAYTFTVVAQNSGGFSSAPSSPSAAVTPGTVPTVPETIAATAGNAQATVTYAAPLSNGGSAITKYTALSGSFSATAAATSPTTPIVVTGLTNGNSYQFYVTATNSFGTSAQGGPSNSVTPSTVPGPPTGLSGVSGNAQVTVSFTPPTNTGGLTISGYTVSAIAPGPTGPFGTNTGSPVVVSGLTNGTSYYFDAVATNADGNSVASASIGPIVPATVPGPPLSPSAVAGNASAQVYFSAPTSNGGATIQSYTVYPNPTGAAPASGTSSPITITGLTNGTAYTFTVKATNSAGTGAASVATNSVTPSASGFIIQTTSLPVGTVGTAYSATITAGGGTSVAPYNYFNPSPGLPGNLTLNESTGRISGTPQTAGNYDPGFQATDSSGSSSFPTSTQVAENDGPGMSQTAGGIATTSSVALIADHPTVVLTTAACYGGSHVGRGLQTTQHDTCVLETYIQGPNSTAGGDPINASQETDLWLINSAVGGTTTFQQWFGTAGFGGDNSGDQDYQACLAFQYSTGSTFLGYGAFTAQTGTGYAGVPQGTALLSGPITLTGAQVPCTLYGFCENTSSLGTNYVATPNSLGGTTTTWLTLPSYTNINGITFINAAAGGSPADGQVSESPANVAAGAVYLISENANPATGTGFFLYNTWDATNYMGFAATGTDQQISVAGTGTSPSSGMAWVGGRTGALMLGSDNLSVAPKRSQFTAQQNFTNTPGDGQVLWTDSSVVMTETLLLQCAKFVGSATPDTNNTAPYIHINLGLCPPGAAFEFDINVCILDGSGANSGIHHSTVSQTLPAYVCFLPVGAGGALYADWISGTWQNGTFGATTFTWSISYAQMEQIIGYMATTAGYGAQFAPGGVNLKPEQFTLNQAHINAEMPPSISTIQLGWNVQDWSISSVSGTTIPGTQISQNWSFQTPPVTAANTSCYASWPITTPGTYQASFNQNSTSLNCYQTVAWAVQGANTGNQETPVKQLALTITGGTGSPNPTANLWVQYQGQTGPNQATYQGTNIYLPSSQTYTLQWIPAVQGANPVAGYDVFYSTTNAAWPTGWTQLNTSLIPTNGANPVAYQTPVLSTVIGTTAGPINNVLTPSSDYWFVVVTQDSAGNTSGPSATQRMYVYNSTPVGNTFIGGPNNPTTDQGKPGGGYKWAGDVNNGNLGTGEYDYTGDPTYSPCWQLVSPGPNNYNCDALPYAGYGYVHWNMWVGACKYLYFKIKFQPDVANGTSTTTTLNWSIHPTFTADVTGAIPSITLPNAAYGITNAAGVWQQGKILLEDIFYYPAGDPTYYQGAIYKMEIQLQNGIVGHSTWLYDVYFGP